MNKTKCKTKTCCKWHPTLKDIVSAEVYKESNCCKCNEKIIDLIIQHDVKPARMIRGICIITGEEIKMIDFIINNPDEELTEHKLEGCCKDCSEWNIS